MSEISFRVHGRPAPQGSKRGFVRGARAVVVDVNHDALMSWRSVVADAARQVYDAQRDGLIDVGLEVDMTFYFTRPKGHFGAGRNRAQLKAHAPLEHIVKPDNDKLERAVFDALTGVVWRDDCLVHTCTTRKRYGLPGVDVCITYHESQE